MAEPLLFISHKHSDSTIAQALGAFIEERSNGRVKVHLSSSSEFKGPRFGAGLNDQLRQALWNTEVLILVYTSADQDWSYCMWECGVATHPQSPNTRTIVFQCGSDVPAPFQDVLRVNARSYEDIKRFTDQFLRDPTFFFSLDAALAPTLRDIYVENTAQELHRKLGQVLPPPDDGLVEEWPTWPYLRVELPRSDVEKIEQASESERVTLTHQIVRDYGVVVASDARAAQLFGRSGFSSRMKFEALLNAWKGKYPDAEATWFDSCCEQIMIGAARGFPVIRWIPMKEVGGDSVFTPVLSRIRRVPSGGSVQFDLYFYNLSDLRAVPETSRMIPSDDFFLVASPEHYEIRFTVPTPDQTINSRMLTVSGTYSRKPPTGALRIFVVSENRNRWWPIAEARLKDIDCTWSAEVTFDKGDFRTLLVAALVAKSNVGLVQYFRELPRYLKAAEREGRQELKERKEFDSLFRDIMPDDIKECDCRLVHVRL